MCLMWVSVVPPPRIWLLVPISSYSWETRVSTETQNSSMGASLHVVNETEFDVGGCGSSSQEYSCWTYSFLFLGN